MHRVLSTSIPAVAPSEPILTPAAQRLIGQIPEADAAQRTQRATQLALEALDALGKLHLPQDEFEMGQGERAQDDSYLELAPYVLSALSKANALLAYVTEGFPAPASQQESSGDDFDFDFDFDLADEDGVSVAKQQDDVEAQAAKSTLPPLEQVADAAHAYASMLRSRVMHLAERLRYALAQQDSWALLAELDDGKHKLTKGVQGFLFGVLSVFGKDFRRDEVLPEYRSVLSESIALRAAIAELSYHIGKFNTALAQADADAAIPLLVGVADHLNRFSERPEYRTMRADDKKAVMDFRQSLYRMRHAQEGMSMVSLRHTVEGFSKFLESMQAINHREVLVLHDKQRLQAALDQVTQLQGAPQSALTDVTKLVQSLGVLQGRNPDLDDLRREALRSFGTNPAHELDHAGFLARLQSVLQQTLMMTG